MVDVVWVRSLLAFAAFTWLGLRPTVLEAQGIRGWAGTTIQAVELRPVAVAPGGCLPDEPCYLPLPQQTSVVGTQDVSLTAWGFGVRGLSATLFLRGRAGLGSDFVWPRSNDHFDALLGYAQLVRGDWTVRAGRQEIRSGLGFSSFDGGSAEWRTGPLRLEGYAGRSLARGLRDPVNRALQGIEDFLPDQSVYLFGGSARTRFRTGSASVRYQRELLADRSGLASERASMDGATGFSRVRITGGIDWDFGLARLGKGHLTASAPLQSGRWVLSATARRYVPYFSLSTIWGFFEPVAYNEVEGRAGWSPSSDWGLWVAGGWRQYSDTETTVVMRAIEDTGRRAEAGAVWTISPAWTVRGEYQLEWGPGGFLSSGDGSLRWTASPRLSLSANAMSFQQIEQYRLGDGRALGGGLSIDIALSERIAFLAGGSVLRHRTEGDDIGSPWNQARMWSTLRIQFGRDPGQRNRMRR